MAVKIRLKKMGKRNNICWKVVVADSRSPRDGRNLEEIGHYLPTRQPAELKLDLARVDYWLGVGAQPSVQANSLIKQARKSAVA